MAVKWAVENGNWNATTTWNDGTLPQVGDEVYCNGHVVTLNVGVNIGSGTIRNDANADYNIITGGYLFAQSNHNIIANLFADTNEIVRITLITNVQYIIVTGNVVTPNTSSAFYKTNQGYTISVVGNVLVRNGGIFGSAAMSYGINATIVGNLTTEGSGNVFGNSFATSSSLVINGNCDLATNIGGTLNSVIINGGLTKRNTPLSTIVTLTLGGNVSYENVDPLLLFKNVTNLNITNVNSLTIKDISTPRTYPYIIVTNADMNNHQQYPQENEVKEGTEYVWGERVGTYTPDYPPESVVLNGYEYDNGDKTGTLDFPQAPTTSDIVTAIKNDSDLGGNITTTNTTVGNISTAVTSIDGKVDIIDTNIDILLSRITSVLTQRLGQSVTVEILQQILVAHLNN